MAILCLAQASSLRLLSNHGQARSRRNLTGEESTTGRCERVERSCWLGERRRKWGSRIRRRRSGRQNGFVDARRLCCRAGIDELLHNQVLASATAASLLGQLAKPFTYAFIGKGFNWKVIFKPGGMPSTHSATVTAAATALGMERGLSDTVFGVAVILACVVMYDAQGVRRSVGKQAEVLNTLVLRGMPTTSRVSESDMPIPNPSPNAIGVELARDPVQAELAFLDEGNENTPPTSKTTAVLNKQSSLQGNGAANLPSGFAKSSSSKMDVLGEGLPSLRDGEVDLQELGDLDGWKHIPLKETVGHTPVEVLVGAVWGIAVAAFLPSLIS